MVLGLNLIYGRIMLIVNNISFTGAQNSENWQKGNLATNNG